jgi:hypothetical protein
MFNEKNIVKMKQTFKDLNIKEKLAIISACVAFTVGWGLTICAAFVPLLLSEQGILWILGQALVYSASVFGLGMYFKAESTQMKSDINKHIQNMERLSIERERLRKGQDIDEIPNEE